MVTTFSPKFEVFDFKPPFPKVKLKIKRKKKSCKEEKRSNEN